jgi:hypothetical protein
MRLLLVCLFSLAVAGETRAQTSGQDTAQKPWGNWSARNANGTTFTGGWTAVPDQKNGTVTGTWTLVDGQGKTVAYGAWSAAKAPTGWSGAWRAVVVGRTEEYLGTWTAGGDLRANAGFGDMFEKAIEATISGTWQMGKQYGAWSIRAAKPDVKP